MDLGKTFKKMKKMLSGDTGFTRSLSDFLAANSLHREASPTVLIWELGGFSLILAKNAIFSLALKVRGYGARCVLCDGVPEACIQRGLEQNEAIESWSKRCPGCLAEMKDMADKYCLDYSVVGDYVDQGKREEFSRLSETIEITGILPYEYLGVRVGELALSSTNRYMKGYMVDVSELKKEDERVYRKYFYAALVNSYLASEMIRESNPVSILTSHGIYVDYAPPMSLGYSKGTNTISWTSGFADSMHYFTVPKTANKLDMRGMSLTAWQERLEAPLSEKENQSLDEFIHNRYFKSKARDIAIVSKPEDPALLKKALGIDNDNPIVCLFTHVSWDACFDCSTMLFETANQWVIESINKMAAITDVNWIIRIHPAEKSEESLFTTDDIIKQKFQSLPGHIKIIWSDSVVNSFGIYQLIDAGITIFGTCGVELPLLGKPVIVAGNAHFSGKGFSVEPASKTDYLSVLEACKELAHLSEGQVKLARQYAYSYFVQRQVPIDMINKNERHWGDVDVTRLDELLPGKNAVMECICDGIVNGTDVIMRGAPPTTAPGQNREPIP